MNCPKLTLITSLSPPRIELISFVICSFASSLPAAVASSEEVLLERFVITAAPADPMEAIQKEMNQFKPAIRDAVITNLSSKTSSELATAAGKELAKEQITNDINSILGGEREVIRVSFGQFIIQ